MRIRFFLAAVTAASVAAGFVVQACGGDSASTTPDAADSSTADTSTAADTSVGVDAADAAPPCDPSKDYLANIADASIADGASTTGACVACSKTKCDTEVAACGADCTCQSIAGSVLECFAKTQDVQTCAGALISVPAATQKVGIALFTCINKQCPTECATAALFDAGADANDGAP